MNEPSYPIVFEFMVYLHVSQNKKEHSLNTASTFASGFPTICIRLGIPYDKGKVPEQCIIWRLCSAHGKLGCLACEEDWDSLISSICKAVMCARTKAVAIDIVPVISQCPYAMLPYRGLTLI